MNISFNWLNELVEIDLTPQELAERITRAGNAVEGVHKVGADWVFDFDLTSNRSDCLSHLGIAREAAAVTGKNLKTDLPKHETANGLKSSGPVKLEAEELCPRFTARIIRGVKVGPSPQWLVERLEAVGERSINNIADITNYVMHELGQPMHSFDLGRLTENRIVVRRARKGEKITTLDEVDRELDDTMLAICDAEKPVAVAGIMGGFHSGINDDTTDVLLEVAYFDRGNIRATSRKLKLHTEASNRFEKGVDVNALRKASDRATELILELAGGVAEDFVDVYPKEIPNREIASKDIAKTVKRLTGLDVSEGNILATLASLGIGNKGGTIFMSPSFRHDISIEEDLVEEVARMVGYDKIGEELPPATSAGEYQPGEQRKISVRRTLANLGFDEAISYSFIDESYDRQIETVPGLLDDSLADRFITIRDSIIEGATRMRPTLIPGLIESIRTNLNHQRRDLRLFEIGKVFASEGEGKLPHERELLAIALTGGELVEGKATEIRQQDFYDIKGALEAAFNALGLPTPTLDAAKVLHLRKGQSAVVRIGDTPVGSIGRLADSIASRFKFRQPVFVAEVDLAALLSSNPAGVFYSPLPVYPSVSRDVSLLVDRKITFEAVREAAFSVRSPILKAVEFVDIFEGKGVPEGFRSLTIRLEYRSDEKTLKDQEVEALHEEILKLLEVLTQAKSRF
jgi:phenylalanyl-tRNA synthetase beta chain